MKHGRTKQATYTARKRPMKKAMKDMAGTVGKAFGTMFHTGEGAETRASGHHHVQL
jgi:hypothetical protein